MCPVSGKIIPLPVSFSGSIIIKLQLANLDFRTDDNTLIHRVHVPADKFDVQRYARTLKRGRIFGNKRIWRIK